MKLHRKCQRVQNHCELNMKYLILGEGPTQRLDDTTLTAEAIFHPITVNTNNYQ